MAFTRPKTTVLIAAILIAAAAIGAAYAVWFIEDEQKTDSSPPFRIALDVWPGFACAFVAQEKGFFEKNGVRVDLMLAPSSASSTVTYESGRADGILDVFSDTVLRNLKGKPTKAVYAIDYSTSGDVIVGKSGLAYPSGLRGKRIGYEGANSFSHLFVSTILSQAGIKPSEVTLVDVPAYQVLEALESGTIDVGHTWEPTRSAALAEGYVQYDSAEGHPGLIIDVLSFDPAVIAARESDVEAVVRSLAEAQAFIGTHPAEAIAISAKAMGMGEAEMREGLSGTHLLDVHENKVAFSYSTGFESLHGVFRRINDFFIENGVTDKRLDSTAFVDPRFVRRLP